MGVIESIPEDLSALYADEYYGSVTKDERQGYSDYEFTAEHSVTWAAALVPLLQPGAGDVLDIGCADGHLLAKLDRAYRGSGIEANANMAAVARARGIDIIGSDLLALSHIQSRFDVITAIAVFEHLRDIREGFATTLRLLQPGGALLFEVPLMSERHDNEVWLTSSLEHVWYPTESSLRCG